VVAALHYGVNLNGVLAFWTVYILTPPPRGLARRYEGLGWGLAHM
jgi:uncharacterized membrane-anchored protein